jgi:hypothetical protein
MGAASAARLLAAGYAWRLTGLETAGRGLVATAASGRETEQELAGMLLVRAGDRSVPLVTDAIFAGAGSPTLVDVLASIGTDTARAALELVSRARPTEIAAAAEDALRTLDEIRRHGE